MTASGLLRRLHRYLGLATAAFLFVAGLTGSVIAFHGELDAALNPSLFYADSDGALSPSTLAAAVEAADPRIRVAFIEVNVKPGRSAVLWVEPKDDPLRTGMRALPEVDYNQVFVVPASGAILGRRQYGGCCLQRDAIVPFLYNLHRRLAMPGRYGEWLMGGVAVLWLIDSFVALAISVPRRPLAMSRWRRVLSVRWAGSAYRKTLDGHRASGVWLWLALTALAVSSVYLNLGDAVVRPVVGLFSRLEPSPYDGAEHPARDPSTGQRSFDDILRLSERLTGEFGDGYRVTGIYHDRNTGIFVTDFDTDRELKLGAAWAAFDPAGRLIRSAVPGQGTAGDVFLQLQLPLHSGRIGGWPGRIVICVAGLAVAALSLTGVILWWRKRRRRIDTV